MAVLKFKIFLFRVLFFLSFIAAFVLRGVAAARSTPMPGSYDSKINHTFSSEQESHLQNFVRGGGRTKKDSKRVMIGSVAPTCTYNECRGCKYKCRAEQVPVEGNDPMNSPYHYKCVCHR